MHTTFPTFSHNENQKATVWLLWSVCALWREGIRTISSVCMSFVKELKSLQNGGVDRLQAPRPEVQPCEPCDCVGSQLLLQLWWTPGPGVGKKTQGKKTAFVYEQSLIIKAPGWRSRKRPSHLSCLLTPGSSGACFGPRAEGSGGNGHDGDSTSRDLGGSHHSRAVWGHPGDCRGEPRGSLPTSHLPRCLGTPCCHHHLHGQQRERGPPARSTTQPPLKWWGSGSYGPQRSFKIIFKNRIGI